MNTEEPSEHISYNLQVPDVLPPDILLDDNVFREITIDEMEENTRYVWFDRWSGNIMKVRFLYTDDYDSVIFLKNGIHFTYMDIEKWKMRWRGFKYLPQPMKEIQETEQEIIQPIVKVIIGEPVNLVIE